MQNITTAKQYNCLMIIACVWGEISTVSFLIPCELLHSVCVVMKSLISIASYFVETITVSDPLQLLFEVFCLCSKVLRSSAVCVTLSFVLVSHLI